MSKGDRSSDRKKLTSTVKGKFMIIAMIISIGAVLAGGSVLYFQGEIVKQDHLQIAQEIERDFEIFTAADTHKLSSTLDILLQDENFMQYYLAGNREDLYEYGQPLFNQLKDHHHITHFYFIQPDGHCFVRIHNKDKYNDQINRFTFKQAQETQQMASGLELGQTAYALRVVKPYYNNGQLIGYMELGQEIDSFLEELRAGEDHDHALIVEKQYLNEASWESVRENAGLRNNWDDIEDQVIIGETSNTHEKHICFNSENVKRVKNGERVLAELNIDGESHMCVGFSFVDAGGRQSGAILSLVNNSNESSLLVGMKYAVFIAVAFFIGFVFVMWQFIGKKFSSSIKNMSTAVQEIKKGNFKTKINIKTGDELEELGDAFNAMSDTLGKLDEEKKKIEHAKTEFMSITSHEMRSPMTPMKGQLQMLLSGTFGKLSTKQKEALDIVLRNATRLDGIIQDFLEVSRIEAARLKFNFQKKTNLNEHVNRLVTEMKVFMPEKKINIITNLEKVAQFEVDPDRVMQVLRNLTNNAIKFTPDNGTINITTEKQGNHILFKVKDSGIGISPENQQRIFEPFFQEEQTMYRQYGGTGLGLAICRGIIEAQGGRIWLESAKGAGTTFYFTIPTTPVREIKPIKLLFSNKDSGEDKMEQIFTEMLGPIGKSEIVTLKVKGLMRSNINTYINEITKLGIITKETAVEFRRKVAKSFGKDTSDRTSTSDLRKMGLLASKEDKRGVKAVGVSLSELQNSGQVDNKKKEEPKKAKKNIDTKDLLKK